MFISIQRLNINLVVPKKKKKVLHGIDKTEPIMALEYGRSKSFEYLKPKSISIVFCSMIIICGFADVPNKRLCMEMIRQNLMAS